MRREGWPLGCRGPAGGASMPAGRGGLLARLRGRRLVPPGAATVSRFAPCRLLQPGLCGGPAGIRRGTAGGGGGLAGVADDVCCCRRLPVASSLLCRSWCWSGRRPSLRMPAPQPTAHSARAPPPPTPTVSRRRRRLPLPVLVPVPLAVLPLPPPPAPAQPPFCPGRAAAPAPRPPARLPALPACPAARPRPLTRLLPCPCPPSPPN